MITDKEIRSLGWKRLCAMGKEVVYTMYTVGRFSLCVKDTHIEIAREDIEDWKAIYQNYNLDLFSFKLAMWFLGIPINGSFDSIKRVTVTPTQGQTPAETPIKPTDDAKPRHVFDRFRGAYVKDLGHMVLECKISLCSLVEPKLSLEISSYRVGEKGVVIDKRR